MRVHLKPPYGWEKKSTCAFFIMLTGVLLRCVLYMRDQVCCFLLGFGGTFFNFRAVKPNRLYYKDRTDSKLNKFTNNYNLKDCWDFTWWGKGFAIYFVYLLPIIVTLYKFKVIFPLQFQPPFGAFLHKWDLTPTFEKTFKDILSFQFRKVIAPVSLTVTDTQTYSWWWWVILSGRNPQDFKFSSLLIKSSSWKCGDNMTAATCESLGCWQVVRILHNNGIYLNNREVIENWKCVKSLLLNKGKLS